jgi:hypothetical protein
METSVKLHSLSFLQSRTYMFAAIFAVGNLLLPQLLHLLPGGGLTWLPIYFFTLIAAYKYGLSVGLLTAIVSPLANSLLFGMPAVEALPLILTKSALIAGAAAYAAHYAKNIFLHIIVAAVLGAQLLGMLVEWAVVRDFFVAAGHIQMAIPGILLQIFGGYLVLRLIRNI